MTEGKLLVTELLFPLGGFPATRETGRRKASGASSLASCRKF